MIDKTSLLNATALANSALSKPSGAPKAGSGANFSDVLSTMLSQTSKAQEAASNAFNSVQLGKSTGSIEEAAASQAIAGVQFQMVVQVRNKLVQAYTDIMNMPV